VRVFYLTRLFSGLEVSFLEKKWSPTGVPTIYRIIEEFDQKHIAKFVFTAKDSGEGYFSNWESTVDQSISVLGLHHKVTILSGVNFFPLWFGRKFRMILREIKQAISIAVHIYKFRPNLVYFDHANVVVACVLSRIMKNTPFVFRVMGVDQSMRDALSGNKIIHKIYKIAYKSQFSLVLCTQDGSGVEIWLKKAICSSAKVQVLLNGIDDVNLDVKIDNQLRQIPNNKIVILFVGKLEVYKGCYEFIKSIALLLEYGYNDFHAVMIGTGTEKDALYNMARENSYYDHVSFIDSLPHNQILVAHNLCDIYVSMNYFGNLSNANLEAIQSDDCMIIPAAQVEMGIDVITESLLGNSVVYVPNHAPEKLALALFELARSKDKRDIMSNAVNSSKHKFIRSWEDRIQSEIRMLNNLVS